MKEAMKRILTITDNHPPLGKEWLPSEAQAMCDGMQEIHVIALEATRAVPVERNADGDSLKKIKAVWKEFPAGGVEHDYIGCGQWWKTNETCGFAYTVDCYRITAKHADKFNPDCMSFEVWARAAIGRGMICRGVGKMDSTGIVKTCDCDNIDGAGMWASSDGHCWPFYANGASWTWTAIPRAAPDAGKAEHLCDTCGKEFATCDAKNIQFGIDIDPSARGAAADRVVICDAYKLKQSKQPLTERKEKRDE